jgi:hypothetical protein
VSDGEPEPIALGTYVTEQLADPPDPDSEHGLPPKLPGSLEPKLTTPPGVLTPPTAVSATTAVHVDPFPTSTLGGEQLTLVEVERAVTVTVVSSVLRPWITSPLYSTEIVADAEPAALGV